MRKKDYSGKEDKFILFSRFGRIDKTNCSAYGIEELDYCVPIEHMEYKVNDEAIRYSRVKKIFTCGGGYSVCIETYDGIKYIVKADNPSDCIRIFREIVNFPNSNELFLDYTREGRDFFEVLKDYDEAVNEAIARLRKSKSEKNSKRVYSGETRDPLLTRRLEQEIGGD